MTGSILQIAAYGIEDIFLTNSPQITYFKIVYKRHTNFSREEIKQNFTNTPNFNSQVSANIVKSGDLMEKMYLVITLPEIKSFNNDNITKVAWVKNPGYSLIDTISIDINNRTITQHYGEWLFLWNEMFNPKAHEISFNKMVGNIPELTSYTNGKKSYKIYIPLQFWFCKNSANALPLVSLEYSDVKVNLSIKDWTEILLISPTHYIICTDSLVNFEEYEYIEQTINNVTATGIYVNFDPYNKRLYYTLLTPNNFEPITSNIEITSQYIIKGVTSNAEASPSNFELNSLMINPVTHKYNRVNLENINLGETYLLINFIYLDDDERMRFVQTNQDYIIEQIYFNEYNEVTGPTETIKINIDNPCKYIVWLLQQKNIYNAKDYYNYTSTFRTKREYDKINNNILIGNPLYKINNNLINNETILCNQKERISYRNSNYFRLIQFYEKCVNTPPSGLNLYSFSLNPDSIQHSGSYNMSKVETIEIKININNIISTNNIGLFRCYAETYNILRISNGFGAVLFEK
jgi:hypothetical protein